MAQNKWMQQLSKMEGAVDLEYDPYLPENVIRSTSPSLNWIFANGCGLPYGQTAIAYGPPKSGKSLISNLFVAGMHQANPDYMAVRFNTEMREGAQGDNDKWGIGPNFQGFDVNEPQYIFDRITKDFVPMLEAGMPLKFIIIDSMEGIEGVKAANKESILEHTIGDHALTIGEGLKRILPIIRRHRIAVLCTSHVRANIKMTGGGKGPETKMAGGYAQKHWFEYYIEVKRDNSADGKVSVDGQKFEDNDTRDFKGNKELTGHKIWCKMKESSIGVAGRTGQFTLDYKKGLVNTYEEIFQMAKNLGLVERPNNRTYIVDGIKYSSKGDFAKAIANDEALAQKIVQAAYARDLQVP